MAGLEDLLEYRNKVDAGGNLVMNQDGSPVLDSMYDALLRLIEPLKTRVKVLDGRQGEVERIGSDGTLYIWFGELQDANWRNEDGVGMKVPTNARIIEERSFRDVTLA